MVLSINMDNKQALDGTKRTMWINTLVWCSIYSRAVIAEFLGTASMMFFGCMSCLPIPNFEHLPPMYGAFGFGIAVMCSIQFFAHISGAHFNPAVSASSLVLGNTSISVCVAYIIAQCVGAICGYYLLSVVAPVDVGAEGVCVSVPRVDLSYYQVFGIEVMITAALCLLCCSLWDPVNKNHLDSAALKFGIAVTGLSLAAGHLTGCSMNPARSFGPAVVSGRWDAHYLFWVAPMIGGPLATFIYKYLFMNRKSEQTNAESLNK